MKSVLFYLLAARALATASCKPQAIGNIPPAIVSAAATVTPTPLANAALWHEAVTNDAKLGGTIVINQYFYSQLAYFQLLENSSNSIVENALGCGQAASTGMQYLHSYPTEFNQAQALDPAVTEGKSRPKKKSSCLTESEQYRSHPLRNRPSSRLVHPAPGGRTISTCSPQLNRKDCPHCFLTRIGCILAAIGTPSGRLEIKMLCKSILLSVLCNLS